MWKDGFHSPQYLLLFPLFYLGWIPFIIIKNENYSWIGIIYKQDFRHLEDVSLLRCYRSAPTLLGIGSFDCMGWQNKFVEQFGRLEIQVRVDVPSLELEFHRVAGWKLRQGTMFHSFVYFKNSLSTYL